MNIYHIHRIASDYDQARGFVIRAETIAKARLIAKDNCGDEGRRAWQDADATLIGSTDQSAKEEVILRDFRAG